MLNFGTCQQNWVRTVCEMKLKWIVGMSKAYKWKIEERKKIFPVLSKERSAIRQEVGYFIIKLNKRRGYSHLVSANSHSIKDGLFALRRLS